ncbi:hypothetical protein DERF_007768 [Dermatophagoides farinae]|uniref:Uncharacterized protein n=1 Tax=Dermatophagoides farinae TaxID=6954 RepID=A0A922HZM5_DERFA|nr:hypothetical protein DERF_007768 [Dermatophagoides farinae]
MENSHDYRNNDADDYPSDYEVELKNSLAESRRCNRKWIQYAELSSDEDESDNDSHEWTSITDSLVENFEHSNLLMTDSSCESDVDPSSDSPHESTIDDSSSEQTTDTDSYFFAHEWFTEDESDIDYDDQISDEMNNVKDDESISSHADSQTCSEKRNFQTMNDVIDHENNNQQHKRLKFQNDTHSNQYNHEMNIEISMKISVTDEDDSSTDSDSNDLSSFNDTDSSTNDKTNVDDSHDSNDILDDEELNSIKISPIKIENDIVNEKLTECQIEKNEKSSDTIKECLTKNDDSNLPNDDETSKMSQIPSFLDHPPSNILTRRRIREIFHFQDLDLDTQLAIQMEEERSKRIMEKNRILDKFAESDPDFDSRVILEFDPLNGKVLLEVDQGIVKILKPHQRDGIRFMYDCTIETFDRLLNHQHQSGCILAHSMGLGKTLQIVAFLQAIMTNPIINKFIRKVLIIVPCNVQKSWVEEFSKWKNEYIDHKALNLFDLSNAKTIPERIRVLEQWHQKGGIFLLTITMFRLLFTSKKKELKLVQPSLRKFLLDPGPEMVIFDEGHLLKSSSSQINNVASQIRTLRRVVLTGTPMQNNLGEFYVMVDFIKPRLLGSIEEFRNRFENPIKNGQHIDSTIFDVAIMKKHAFVLHKMLSFSINRCNYKVLVPFLPPKYEYVLYLRLSSIQSKLYKHHLNSLLSYDSKHLIKDFWSFAKINNHPVLFLDPSDEDLTTCDTVDDYNDDDKESKPKSSLKTRASNNTAQKTLVTASGYYKHLLGDELKNLEDIDTSVKFTITFAILDHCQEIGDKLLIFSQSLRTLDLIEKLLKSIKGKWEKGVDYFRIDGSVKIERRDLSTKLLNDPKNKKARLMLISTRAGGIGINLVGANRCIIFDCSWNPANDVQALFRIFRFGQVKPVYIYRLAGYGTMENRVYQRQISKQSISGRVVDLNQIRRHFTRMELEELYTFTEKPDKIEIPIVPVDQLLAKLLKKHLNKIISYHDHDFLLENLPEEQLSNDDKLLAWKEWRDKCFEQQNNIDDDGDTVEIKNDPPKLNDDDDDNDGPKKKMKKKSHSR